MHSPTPQIAKDDRPVGPATAKVELLAPAGSFEKLQIAIHYGADAVYLGGQAYSLRNQAANFTESQMAEAISYAHPRGVKIYVACNIFARNDDLAGIERFIKRIGEIGADGVIISDPGVIALARRLCPHMPIHLSTQANTTNRASARFWKTQGITRLNAARELRLAEIREMVSSDGPEIEVFVHGAMCIAYSGRCLLSNYLCARDGNQGLCTQTCRWRYQVTEETRPGQYFPLEEDTRGAYIFSSRDLCMLNHLPELVATGVRALKIEGRMKGIHYLAATVGAYRMALDALLADTDLPAGWEAWQSEVALVTRRELSTGFYFADPSQTRSAYTGPQPQKENLFIAKVMGPASANRTHVEVRNRLTEGMDVQVLRPRQPIETDSILGIWDEEGRSRQVAQPGQKAVLQLQHTYKSLDLIRKI